MCLESISKVQNRSVSEILLEVREKLLLPIFAKPLRALPFQMQIGNIDTITYCMSLQNEFLPFTDELLRLLLEALALADAEDQALIGKGSPYKSASSLVNLRVVCIGLLSAAMTNTAFSNANQEATRSRIIAVFFKSLYSKSPEIVDMAFKGMMTYSIDVIKKRSTTHTFPATETSQILATGRIETDSCELIGPQTYYSQNDLI